VQATVPFAKSYSGTVRSIAPFAKSYSGTVHSTNFFKAELNRDSKRTEVKKYLFKWLK